MRDDGVRVLLVEDNPQQARLVRAFLSKFQTPSYVLVHADRLSTGLERLRESSVDIILLDLTLPDSAGLDTFHKVHAQAGDIPIVILSGIDDEELAVRAVRGGAQDYLLKGDLTASALVHALNFAIERHKVHAAAPAQGPIPDTTS
jgi:DNA-binding response OmpR family regulator